MGRSAGCTTAAVELTDIVPTLAWLFSLFGAGVVMDAAIELDQQPEPDGIFCTVTALPGTLQRVVAPAFRSVKSYVVRSGISPVASRVVMISRRPCESRASVLVDWLVIVLPLLKVRTFVIVNLAVYGCLG